MDAFEVLATRGPTLFTTPSTKMAVLRLKGNQNGVKLGRVGYCHSKRCPVTHVDFLPPEGRLYLISKTLNPPFREL